MKRDDDTLDLLLQKLRWLKLPGMTKLVPDLLDQAASDNLTALDVLHRLADEERRSRLSSGIDPEVRKAEALEWLEKEVWPHVPPELRGRPHDPHAEDEILGYGPDGV